MEGLAHSALSHLSHPSAQSARFTNFGKQEMNQTKCKEVRGRWDQEEQEVTVVSPLENMANKLGEEHPDDGTCHSPDANHTADCPLGK